MSRNIWSIVACVLVISKSTFAIPLDVDDDELPEFDITYPETSETSTDLDDAIDIFSIDDVSDDTLEILPECGSSDFKVELDAEELQVNDFNSDFTSQEHVPTDTDNQTVEERAKEIELSNKQKSKNDEILSKIETAILKSRSNDCNNIVTAAPEFVPIFKPRSSEDVAINGDARKNPKPQPAAPKCECQNTSTQKLNEENQFVLTGLYLQPLTDLNPNAFNLNTAKGSIHNAIQTGYTAQANLNTNTANINFNPGSFPSVNQNQIPSNNIRPDFVTSFPSSNSLPVNLGMPNQNPIVTLNPNQKYRNTQTTPCNSAPCQQNIHFLNTPNQMSLQNANLRMTDPASYNVLLNPNIHFNTKLNTVSSKEAASPCRENMQLLNSNTMLENKTPGNFEVKNANFNSANQIRCSNLNMNSGKPIQNPFIASKNSASENVINSSRSVRNKPLFFYKPETFTRHEVCGDYLKKKTYTVLVPFQVSKIV